MGKWLKLTKDCSGKPCLVYFGEGGVVVAEHPADNNDNFEDKTVTILSNEHDVTLSVVKESPEEIYQLLPLN